MGVSLEVYRVRIGLHNSSQFSSGRSTGGLRCAYCCFIAFALCLILLLINGLRDLLPQQFWLLEVDVPGEAALWVTGTLGCYILKRCPSMGLGLILLMTSLQPPLLFDPTADASLDATLCMLCLVCYQIAQAPIVGSYLTMRLVAVTTLSCGKDSCHEQVTGDTSKGIAFQVLQLLLLIGGVEPNPGPQTAVVCKVCMCKFSSVKSYCHHFTIHLSTKHQGIPCTFKGCQAQLATLASFQAHFSKFHGSSKSITVQNDCNKGIACPCEGCTEMITSRQEYLAHMCKVHLKKEGKEQVESFTCIFEGCSSHLKTVPQFRTHNSRFHPAGAPDTIFSVCPGPVSSPDPGTSPHQHDANVMDVEDTEVESDSNETASDVDLNYIAMDSSDSEEDLYPDSVVKDELARFYLRLEAEEVLPTSTVQVIASEIKLISELIHYKLKKSIRTELEKIKMERIQVDQIISSAFQNDPIFNIHHKHMDTEQLGTDHSRMKFWKKIYRFIEPKRVFLGFSEANKKRYAHLVSVKESLIEMLKDRNVKDKVLKSFASGPKNTDIISDYSDGSAFKEHAKCHQHKGIKKCIQLLFFQDGFDPNAFSSGVHKPIGFYWTLGNLPAKVRSRLNLIQLAFMVLEKDMKNSEGDELKDLDRLKEALDPLIQDLVDLRTNGIIIDGERIHVCVLFLLGDSLGQNFIGRFVQNFSSAEFSCRFCPISKTEFLKEPFVTMPLRTPTQYDEYVKKSKMRWVQVRRQSINAQKKAREDARKRAQRVAARSSAPSKKVARDLASAISKSALQKLKAQNFRGVKYRPSPFNREDLQFHVVGNQPPCLAHDLFEGIIKTVVPKILEHCIKTKQWFSLETLNRRIASFKCQGTDALDRPKPLKSLTSLAGHAVENWNFLRLLCFIIGDLIEDEDDPFWQIYLSLKEICALICAPRISRSQVEYLRGLIEEYLSNIKDHLPACLTPKHHYLCHYPDLILRYGPLMHLFTLRFESKHAFFKRVILACKNYINVTYTMARKYMCRSAFDRSIDLLPRYIIYEDPSPVDMTDVSEEIRTCLPNDVEELKKVSISGTDYHPNQYLILGSHDCTGLRVGCIKKVLLEVNKNEVLFLIEENCASNSYSGYYKIERSAIKSYILQTAKDLPDYYPLLAYSFNGDLCLTLKHAATFMN